MLAGRAEQGRGRGSPLPASRRVPACGSALRRARGDGGGERDSVLPGPSQALPKPGSAGSLGPGAWVFRSAERWAATRESPGSQRHLVAAGRPTSGSFAQRRNRALSPHPCPGWGGTRRRLGARRLSPGPRGLRGELDVGARRQVRAAFAWS
jgi:hypothetical protein